MLRVLTHNIMIILPLIELFYRAAASPFFPRFFGLSCGGCFQISQHPLLSFFEGLDPLDVSSLRVG